MNIRDLAIKAKKASKTIMSAGTNKKNEALRAICDSLIANTDFILAENKKDIQKATEKGMSAAMTDRLRLTSERIIPFSDISFPLKSTSLNI